MTCPNCKDYAGSKRQVNAHRIHCKGPKQPEKVTESQGVTAPITTPKATIYEEIPVRPIAAPIETPDRKKAPEWAVDVAVLGIISAFFLSLAILFADRIVIPPLVFAGIGVLSGAVIRKHTRGKHKRSPFSKKPKAEPESEIKTRRFFSEEHPRAYHLAKSLLPRLHVYAFAILMAWAMLGELMLKNYDFIIDWYRASWVLPTASEIITTPGLFDYWWAHYGYEFIVIVVFLVMCVMLFYALVWRTFFRTYLKKSDGSPRKEGRVYWRTNNMWTRGFDRLYHSSPRTVNSYWIKQGVLPLFNPINPPSTLIRIDTTPEERWEEQGLWKLQVEEKRHRLKVLNNPKHLVTSDIPFQNGYIPTDYAEGRFSDMSKKCVNDTTDLSFANPNTRNTVMTSSLRLTTPKLRRNIVAAREQGQPDSDKSN